MKKILLTTIAFTFMASAVHAACGPKVNLSVSHGQSDSDIVGKYNSFSDRDDSKISLGITWSLGNDYCSEQEYQDLQYKKNNAERSKQYGNREKIRILKETLALCAKYGDDHPLLAGKCK